MAGDWIKVEHATLDKPEVLKMARMLGISRREMVGTLLDFLVWCDTNCVDGAVDGVVDADVDVVMSCPGLSAVLRDVKWVSFETDPPRMLMSNWGRHNGESAKKRALKNHRQARWRSKNVDGGASTKASTREEKRRSNTPIVPGDAFTEFWLTYPRKVKKPAALKAWTRLSPDDTLQARIIADVARRKLTDGDWRRDGGTFIPHPSTYLNERRWEDSPVIDLPLPQRKVVA